MDIIRPSEGRVSGSTPDARTNFFEFFFEKLKSCYPVPLPDAARDFLCGGLAMKVPVEVLVHSKTKTLELAYEDGTRAIFPFEFLRVFSPSAEVQGHSPEEAVLQVGCANVGLRGVEPVGQYALRLMFDDGHDTGIYSWDYFEKLRVEHDALWGAYLEELASVGASRDPADSANAPFLARMKPKKTCSHG